MATEEKQLNRLVSKHINDNDSIDNVETLEHIASCDICAASYAEMIETNSMIKAPHYMKANILHKSSDFEKQELKKLIGFYQYSKQLQLFHYSMKVGVAMCGALTMLFLSSFGSFTTNIPQGQIGLGLMEAEYTEDNFVSKLNYGLREFTNNIEKYADTLVSNNRNDMEGNKNEEEKK